MYRASRWLAAILLCLPAAAVADTEGQLKLFETEARQIAQTLPQPNPLPAQLQRRLVDAEVAFSLGDYNTAALMLFEIAGRPGPDQERATYYLAESLLQKRDRGAARTYFNQVVAANNTSGKHYQLSLIRLIEIAIAQQDDTDVETHIAALDRLSPAARLPQVPYVKGKWAFSQGKHDEALAYFQDVPKASGFELQALYYVGTTNVAKKELARATAVFLDLTGRKPASSRDRRVIELSQLALGRIYYEQDQPSKAVDSYLLVDRNSDLFPDALYEVAWVYVKGKQFDKALRALELLALSEPDSRKTPTVRILEGNLRIRKAQLIRAAMVAGTVNANEVDPEVEYEKAAKVFADTHDAYHSSYLALAQMVDDTGDPAEYLAQLAGRQSSVFQAITPMPEAAAQFLREEPRVQRAVANQIDLQTIQEHLAESEETIARLEGVIAANDKTIVYPPLAARRSRIGEIQNDLIAIRNTLAEQQLQLIAPSGELASVSANRKQLAQQFAASPSPEAAQAAQLADNRMKYDEVDAGAIEVSTQLDSSQAIAVAVRTYVNTPPVDGVVAVPAEQKSTVNTELSAIAAEAFSIEAELREVQRELALGRDLAGVGDESIVAAREARRALRAAQDAEHRLLAGYAAASRDRNKSNKLTQLGAQAARISTELDQTEQKIDGMVDQALAEARRAIAEERANIETYKAELAEYELESRAIGSTLLAGSFKNVKAKFYDVIVRTDVGAVDVVWSQKEDADDELKRLNLSRARELKQLTDEFKDILDTTAPSPALPASAPMPAPAAPLGSPDKGASDARVSPGGGTVPAPTPTVRPDNETAPKGGTR